MASTYIILRNVFNLAETKSKQILVGEEGILGENGIIESKNSILVYDGESLFFKQIQDL